MQNSILSITILLLISGTSIVYCCRSTEYVTVEATPLFPVKAIAVFNGYMNNITGYVLFEQASSNGNIKVNVNITGLSQGSTNLHGFHIHATGITSTSQSVTTSCGSSGMHFNPTNQTHGDRTANVRHNGDLGNIMADSNGTIVTTFSVDRVMLYGVNSVVGRTIVLHQKPDDLGLGGTVASLATGDSGARIACSVIGYD